MMLLRFLCHQCKCIWTRDTDIISRNLDFRSLQVTSVFVLGSRGELGFLSMVILEVFCSYWVFLSLTREIPAGKGLLTHPSSALSCAPVSSAAAPGWLSLSKLEVGSCSVQDFVACWIIQICVPHRKHSFSFLIIFFFPQCSQMSGFVSHLHVIKSKLLVIEEPVERGGFSPICYFMLGCERSQDHVSLGSCLAGILDVGRLGKGARGWGGAPWLWLGHIIETPGDIHCSAGQGGLSVVTSCT